ncbi:hypothetical protein ACFYR1_40360 [Streptomyces canus]
MCKRTALDLRALNLNAGTDYWSAIGSFGGFVVGEPIPARWTN